MNDNMAALAKGAISVVVVAGVLVAGTASLFHISVHRSTPAGGPPGQPAPAQPGAPQPSAGGATLSPGQAQAPTGTPQAPAGAGGAATQTAAAPQGQQSAQSPPAPQMQPAPPPPPPRKGTDFSFPQARWDALLAQSGDTASSASLANSGKPEAGVAACASCHGAQGVPAAGTPFPILAGASPAYTVKQLLDYRDGTRQHPIMTGIAKGLSDQDIAAVARYYGSLPAPPLKPPAPNPQDRGQVLHGFGDNALALAACANCHGANGEGENPMLPRLAGQSDTYLATQLDAFRSGQRANDDLGTMRDIAKRLSAEDQAALVKYYSGMRQP
ncbi:hypothetical protein CAL14_06780 [Bordetella genomosp. 9]|uniref:c-type cytochrome n=1 Tax=Bordetella genomosp. 9 TaxID=1416803 RepID=UPI000A28D817|nr:c-type cytochrome [Bordetella genomosp. 9]ARP90032.1 hypothetical protein CAL14_06780 [Bordetella genomosp. 9]